MISLEWLQILFLWGIPLIFAITVHEVAHGWMANQLGDPTAKMLGRLTLNPIKHIDLIGTILLPVILVLLKIGFMFGWAKPVPVTWINLRNPKRDMAFVAVAGPIANLFMAFGWAAAAKLGLWLIAVPGSKIGLSLYYMGIIGIRINCVLLLLNLLPLPPLDGSRILSSFLAPKVLNHYMRLEPYGFFILLALLLAGILNKVLLPLTLGLFNIISASFGLSLTTL